MEEEREGTASWCKTSSQKDLIYIGAAIPLHLCVQDTLSTTGYVCIFGTSKMHKRRCVVLVSDVSTKPSIQVIAPPEIGIWLLTYLPLESLTPVPQSQCCLPLHHDNLHELNESPNAMNTSK